MRRHILVTAGAALLGGAVLAGCSGSDDSDDGRTDTDSNAQPANQADEVALRLSANLATIRTGTAAYVTDLSAAQDDGYLPMTQQVSDIGYHFLNPTAPEEFDPDRPSMLVYTGDEPDAQLSAVGWVFTEEPSEPPMEGTTYGSFPAACHYEDGSYVEGDDQNECAESNPETDAAFTYWHPELSTLYVWAWMSNPEGLYSSTNSLMSSFTQPSPSPTGEPTPTPCPTPTATGDEDEEFDETPSPTPTGAPTATPCPTPTATPSPTPTAESEED